MNLDAIDKAPSAPTGEGLDDKLTRINVRLEDMQNGSGSRLTPEEMSSWRVTVCAASRALRARTSEPEAREAVAWRYRWKPTPRSEPGDWRPPTHSRWSVQDRTHFEEQPLYAHPSPDETAEKLRAAVAALEPFAKLAGKFTGVMVEVCDPHPANPSGRIQPMMANSFALAALSPK